ncbi:MAG: hypothetical protein H6872_09435 [Methylobacteriaceae bacterium]|nr:hypothetical protein [Rhodoblastus sp.]MCC0005347.1 hypothetical protein [Methylobacteriaceae bacterium]
MTIFIGLVLHFVESVLSPRPSDPILRRLRCLSSATLGRRRVDFTDLLIRNPAENVIEPRLRVDAIEFGFSIRRPNLRHATKDRLFPVRRIRTESL